MASGVTGYVSNAFVPFFDKIKSSTNSSLFDSSTGGIFSTFQSNRANSSNSTVSTIGSVAAYIFAVLVILLFILVIVHFFLTPIFQMHPGGPGIIPIPGGDDGVIFWKDGMHPQLLEKDLPIQGQSSGYSLILDMFIQNPLEFSNQYRILFSRGAVRKETPTGSDTFLGIMDTYNLVVALKPDTNDLVVSVMSAGTSGTKSEENVVLSNVPVQQSFRLGIIVMDKALEVYLNGNLVKTRKYDYTLQSVVGPIDAVNDAQSKMVLYPLLKIWKRVLSTSEMRYATPTFQAITPPGALTMPSGSFCSIDSSSIASAAAKTQTSLSNVATEAQSALSSFSS